VYDGKRVSQTSLIKKKMPASQAALKYKELWQAEKVFRDIKSVLETRPIYHRRDETIRGHATRSGHFKTKYANDRQGRCN